MHIKHLDLPTSNWFLPDFRSINSEKKRGINFGLVPVDRMWWLETVMNFQQQPNNGGLPVAVDLEFLWLEFCTDLLVILGSASRNCQQRIHHFVWMLYRKDVQVTFDIFWWFDASDLGWTRSLEVPAADALQVCGSGQKSRVFHGTSYTLPALFMFEWKMVIHLMLPPRVHACPEK